MWNCPEGPIAARSGYALASHMACPSFAPCRAPTPWQSACTRCAAWPTLHCLCIAPALPRLHTLCAQLATTQMWPHNHACGRPCSTRRLRLSRSPVSNTASPCSGAISGCVITAITDMSSRFSPDRAWLQVARARLGAWLLAHAHAVCVVLQNQVGQLKPSIRGVEQGTKSHASRSAPSCRIRPASSCIPMTDSVIKMRSTACWQSVQQIKHTLHLLAAHVRSIMMICPIREQAHSRPRANLGLHQII